MNKNEVKGSINNTFFYHLEALRSMLLHIMVALLICWPISYFFTSYFLHYLIEWCCPAELGKLNYFSPMEVFIAELKLSLVISAVISYPYNAFQIWKFILPALYEGERRALKWWIFSASMLFSSGAVFCVGVILPMVMKFSSNYSTGEIQATVGLSNFLELTGWMILAFGLMFQFPLVVLLAVRFGLISVATLQQKRPYVIVFILILSALLTPPDVISQLMLSIPSYILFEIGLLLSRKVEPKKEVTVSDEQSDGTMEDFYDFEYQRDKKVTEK